LNLINLDDLTAHIELKPRLVSSDLRVRLQAAVHGIGIALLPEQVISAPLKERLVERVLPEWSGAMNILHLVYPTPQGMLPSVRSLVDYLLIRSSLAPGARYLEPRAVQLSSISVAARLPTFLSAVSRPRSSSGLSSENTLFICPE
jgi:hypothetical protein